MTRAAWAERMAERYCHTEPNGLRSVHKGLAVKVIEAQHKRAVRVVKQEIRKLEVIKSRSVCNAEIAEAYASITVLRDILAALQRGRE